MMKKFLISSFILFFSLFGIKNVNAEEIKMNTSSIGSFTYCDETGNCTFGDTGITPIPFTNANHTYYGSKVFNSQSQLIQINLKDILFNSVSESDTVNFYLYEGRSTFTFCSIYTPDSNYFQFNANSFLPLVTMNDHYCNVNIYGMSGTNEQGDCSYERRFYVSCPYYEPSGSETYIQSYYDRGSSSPTAVYWGISDFIITKSNQTTLNDIETGVNDLNDNITSSDTTESESQANSFFEGFESNDYGLSDIITMPLDLINGLTSNSCVALSLTIPFVNKSFDLPCMSSIYQEYFGNFFTLYQTITFGFVAYWVVVKIFALVKGFKDPDDDKVEVMDL